MKLKYYLRGLGVGILVSTIILSIGFKATLNKKIEEAIVKFRSTELAEADKELKELEDLLNQTPEEAQEEEKEDLNNLSKEEEEVDILDEEALDENYTKELDTGSQEEEYQEHPDTNSLDYESQEVSDIDSSDEESYIDTEDDTINENSEEPNEKLSSSSDSDYIHIEIKQGMNSEEVAAILENLGIVDDKYDFNNYLKDHGFSRVIRVGTYKIAKNATYEQIAEIIVKK